MTKPIDWVGLAYQLETITDSEGGYSSLGGGEVAAKVIAHLLGDEVILSAVDAVLAQDRGSEVARSLLRLLKPRLARQRCLDILNGSLRDFAWWEAGHLLSDICDRDWEPYYSAMTRHPEPAIRGLSMRLLENTVFAGWLELDEAIALLTTHLDDPHTLAQAQQMIDNFQEDLVTGRTDLSETD